MNRQILCAALLACTSWCAPRVVAQTPSEETPPVSLPAKENFHLFVLAGQSNMAGRGKIAPQDLRVNQRVLMLNKARVWVPAVDPLHFDKPKLVGVGLGKTFALQYAADHPNVTVGLVPCAVGGSAIATWLPGGFHDQTKSHPYDDALARCKMAESAGVFKGVLWHQGESDSTPKKSGEYLAVLKRVIHQFRGELGQDIPWVIGQLGQFREKPWNDSRHIVDRAHRKIVTSEPRMAFVPSGGLIHRGDKTHFSAPSVREFGRRYYDAWKFLEANCNRLTLAPSANNPRNSEGDFISLEDGRILFVYSKFSGGPGDHAAADLVSRVSHDGGSTWSREDKLVLSNEGKMNTMSVSLLRLDDGRIAMFYLRKHSLTDCRPVMRTSSDEAASWSPPIEIVPESQTGYYVVNNDRVIQLEGGRILVPVALHHSPGQAKPDWAGQVGCYVSDDRGDSWRRSTSMQALRDTDKRIMTQEPGIVQLGDGSLMMWVRTDAGFQYQCFSSDKGNNWTSLEPMALASPRSPASIERIKQTGDLIAIWNDHQFVPPNKRKSRTPLSFALSSDDGKTWSRSIPVASDPQGWYCYSAIDFVGDSLLLATCAGSSTNDQHLSTTIVRKLPVDLLYQRAFAEGLVQHQRIWSGAAHNAFTDLCEFQGRWYCVFREGTGHISGDGKLRVLRSQDLDHPGTKWESVALLSSELGDLRDAKLTTTPDGRLMLSGAAALPKQAGYRHQSLAWFSTDGDHWSAETPIGDKDYWLWRTTWRGNSAYSIGYHTGASDDRHLRLFHSHDGSEFSTLVERLYDIGYANETSLLFDDQQSYCLLRRDGTASSAQLGRSSFPFKTWTWTDLGTRIGGPHMIRIPDGRVFAAGRLYQSQDSSGNARADVRTSVCQLNLKTGQLTEVLRLPSGGDNSYPGLAWHNNHLWVSYYSSHEAGEIATNPLCKTAIYLAKIKLP